MASRSTTSRAQGRFFTPRWVVDRLVSICLRPGVQTVCDPTCGDGRFLHASARSTPHGSAVTHLFGADLQAIASRVATAGPPFSFTVADTLVGDHRCVWPDAPAEGFDLVIGNPPFRNQLERETSMSVAERAAVRARYGAVAGGYADTASMFLVAACQMAAPTGRVALIMPMSFLAARDAGAARRRVLELATLEALWIAPESVFPDADVRVCAVILDRSGPRRRSVRRWVGEHFDPIEPCMVDSDQLMTSPTWSHLAAPAFGVPEVALDGGGRLGELVTATAGFRDEFYGLAPLVVEHDPEDRSRDRLAPLITSGLIDPGSVSWGERTTRVAGTVWKRPAVDLDRLDPGSSLGRWVTARRRPKLVVATQTKVIEAAPDPRGDWIPSTPVIAVHGEMHDLWLALAVLLAPPTTAWARSRYGGTALSADAVKLSASQVADLPLPPDLARWTAASDMLRDAHPADGPGRIDLDAVAAAGQMMTTAYGCSDSVTRWWEARLRRSLRGERP